MILSYEEFAKIVLPHATIEEPIRERNLSAARALFGQEVETMQMAQNAACLEITFKNISAKTPTFGEWIENK